MLHRVSPGRKFFLIFNTIFCISIAVVCILPVLHIFAISLSSKNAVFSGHVLFWPVELTADSYQFVVRDQQFFISYSVTILRAVLGWVVNMALTMLAAYPLSLRKKQFPARTFFVWYFMATILFNGGMIPTYLVVDAVGLLDTIWSLVLVNAVPVFNVILMVNFMKTLPESLSEAAYIDGAGHFVTLTRIILPLCKASIATISLFVILSHWNAWFDGMIYIKSMNLKPLQTYLRSVLIVDNAVSDSAVFLEDIIANVSSDSANGAKIFLALLPVMCIYPFLQKYFAQGIVRGSVKD